MYCILSTLPERRKLANGNHNQVISSRSAFGPLQRRLPCRHPAIAADNKDVGVSSGVGVAADVQNARPDLIISLSANFADQNDPEFALVGQHISRCRIADDHLNDVHSAEPHKYQSMVPS